MDDVQVDTFGLRINQNVCFTTHRNAPNNGTMKRQLKVLRDVAPLLKATADIKRHGAYSWREPLINEGARLSKLSTEPWI